MSDKSITLNWTAIDLGLSDTEKKLDVFFQPGLSWVKESSADQSTKVIALLFLENDPEREEAGMDFQRLIKGMLRWTFVVAGNENTDVEHPKEYYQVLYEAFLEKPFEYQHFLSFLKKNFEFRIQEPPVRELKGTIFPMFPQLILDVGKNPNTIPTQFKVNQQKLQEGFGPLTAQFAYDFDFQEAALDAEELAREFIFEDYGRLLLRTALQSLQDFLLPGEKKNMEALITAIEKNTDPELLNFDDLAAIASRFLLHGLRIPVANEVGVKPLYEATGQQFNLAKARDNSDTPASGTKPDYTIQLSRPVADKGFIDCFAAGNNEGTNKLVYTIEGTESTDNAKYPLVALMEGFKKIQSLSSPLKFGAQNGAAQILAMPFYRDQARMYPMRKWIRLSGNSPGFLLEVPSSLRQFLAATTVNPTINLYQIPSGERNPNLEDKKITNTAYQWAVQIHMMVRQIPRTEEAGFLTGVLELAEISEEQINLLESVIQDGHLGSADIQVLSHAAGTDDLAPLPVSVNGFTLLRHNFSTNGSIPASAPPAIVPLPAKEAGIGEKRKFLQMLWEGATLESGGYFFLAAMSDTEHTSLFGGKEEILLSLLIKYDITDDPIDDPIFDFHNTVELKLDDPKVLENNLLIARVEGSTGDAADYSVPVPVLPPGFVGFKYNAAEPSVDPVSETLQAAAQLRDTPSLTGSAIGRQIAKGATVSIHNLSRDGKWAFVQVSNKMGWLPLSTQKPATDDNPASTITHLDIPNTLSRDQALANLKSLYHLLGYGITDDPLSKDLPIGPQEEEEAWTYEKLIPAHAKLAGDKPSTWPVAAPPWEQNPYRGITPDSMISLDFWWQDIYGNKITNDVVSQPFDVRYTDPLIGINQWPSLSEQYQFTADKNGRWLEIELMFSPAPYAGLRAGVPAGQKEALSRRLKADLITYQKLYYQLQGPGVAFTVTTSLDDKWSGPIAVDTSDQHGKSLSSFVLQIYSYLATLEKKLDDLANAPDYSGKPLLFRLDLSGLSPKKEFIQGVSCWLTMKRDAKLVHKDLKENPKLKGIYENRAVLSPRHESLEIVIPANQTLSSLATAIDKALKDRRQALNEPPAKAVSPIDIVLQHRALEGIIQGGIDIEIDNLILADTETFGKKRQELKAQEEPNIRKIDSATGLEITKTPGLYEAATRKIQTVAGESFQSLTARIDREMKDTFGPRYPVNFRLEDLAKNFLNQRPFLKKDTRLTLEPLNIRMFAHNFSQAFPQFHVAVSEERNAGGGQANAEDGPPVFLFAVRLGGDGINYDIAEQDPNFYALPPLATTLFSGKVMIYSDPKTSGGGQEKEVQGIDPNLLARDFLAALEEVLSPEILAPAQKLDPASTAITELLSQKHELAKKIAGTLAPILVEDNQSNTRLATAREAIQQRLLDNLLEGFDIESIVQYEATVTPVIPTTDNLPEATPAAAPPPRMVGKAKVLRVRTGEDPLNRLPAEADDLDYTLTNGYFELDQHDGKSSFTYLFDTKTPEKFGNLEMEMEFQPLEMEFNLASFPDDAASFESSNKLRFILPANLNIYRIGEELAGEVEEKFKNESAFKNNFKPFLTANLGKKFFSLSAFEDALKKTLPEGASLNDPEQPYRKYCDALLSKANPNYMGRTAVPIPLRHYPLAPSLILQQAEADESSREVIRDLREWRYTIVYEHPEVAQDSIDCLVRLNVKDSGQADGSNEKGSTSIPELVRLLLNFTELLPVMKADIEPLKKAAPGDPEMADAKKALEDFAFLTKEIAGNWAVLRQSISEHYQSATGLHFDISEETLTYRENTNEAVTREGIVFTRSGLPAADLIQLDKRFVEKDGIPSAEELLKRGLIKQNSSYFKKLVPSLKLPGFLLARLVELDKAKVERLTEEEFNKSGIIKRGEGENLVYLIKVFPGAELSPLINDPTETANPEIVPATTKTDESRTFFFLSDPDDQTFFGDSSIPDRKFSIDNLDLLQQQNAWASIWLSRNKNLVFEKKTNPDFIFRTPAVRFTNELTPSIVNREPWDVATLPTGGTASDTTLVSHLTHMLQLFQPGVREAVAGKHDRYELQIACRYAFSLAEGSGLNEDLLTTLPILLGLRLTPDQLPAYPAKLSKEISSWFKANLPVEENASLIFSVDVFSQLHKDVNASLPLLRVSHLELHLKNITNMPEIRTGNG